MLIDSLTKLSFGGNSNASSSTNVIGNTGSGIKFGNNSATVDDQYGGPPIPPWPPIVTWPPKSKKA